MTNSIQSDGRAKGGQARAKILNPEQRTEIAKKAALARWEEQVPVAHHGGNLTLGGVTVDCYVTEDEERVISGRGFQDVLQLVDASDEPSQKSGSRITRLFNNKELKPLFNNSENLSNFSPIKCKYQGRVIHGYKAEVLVDICEVVIRARDLINKKNMPRIKIIAEQCEVLLFSLAKTGITALVDEATGYQSIRDKNALQQILNKFLTDYARKWAKIFPDEFWVKLLKAKGFDSYIGLPRPAFVGHWVNDVIYSRLAPGILDELKKKNPRAESGSRKYKHTQFLSEDHGVPELKEHLIKTMTIMDMSIMTGQPFDVLLDAVLPKFNVTLSLNLPHFDN